MYKPYQIILSPSNACNLQCTHCFIDKQSGKLCFENIEPFLQTVVSEGINHLGFSGGEPFLQSDFLQKAISLKINNAHRK
ncbi:MAG: radical SAM protein [Treponemataceae bacterium]